MWQQPDGTAVAPASDEAMRKPMDVVGVGQETGRRGVSTDVAGESSMASPRWIPVPDYPPLSVQLPPAASVGVMWQPSASFARKFAPSQVSVSAVTNFDLLPLWPTA